MLYTILGVTVPLVLLAVFSAWGLLIGIKRVRVRFACVAISFLIALIMAFVVKNLQTLELMSVIEPYMRSNGDEALLFFADAKGLHDVIAVCGGSVLAPWVFLIVFVLLNAITWIVSTLSFLAASLVHGRSNDEEDSIFDEDEDEEPFRLISPFACFRDEPEEEEEEDEEEVIPASKKFVFPRVLFYAAAQVVLTMFVLLTPVIATLDYLPGIIVEADESGALRKIGETQGQTLNADLFLDEINSIKGTPVVQAYRLLGGNTLCEFFSAFEVNGRASNLKVELTAISEFGFDIFRLYQHQIEDYTEEEIVLLREIDKDMHKSVFLPIVSGEFIHAVTDAWLDENGPREFLGMVKPAFDKDTTSMAAEPFDHILEAFHEDAFDIHALLDDFQTVEQVMEILITEGVIQTMNNTSTNALVDRLTTGTVLDQLLDEFDKNISFRPLRQDIITIGMRSVGSSLKSMGNSDEIYSQFNDNMANKLNEFTANSDMTPEEKKEKMTTTLRESYEEKSGKALELSDDVVGLYADALLEEFDGRDDVTPEEMSRFFESYSGIEREG